MASIPEFHSQRRDIRLGAIAALSNGGVAPFPTMAGERIYDTKQSPYLVDGDSPLPAVSVYTDTQKRTPLSAEGGAPFANGLEIILELSIGGSAARVETDAELEDALDQFEEQVLAALLDTQQAGARAFRSMFKKLHSVDSMRLGNDAGSTRLAMRDLLIVVDFDQRQCAPISKAFPRLDVVKMCASLGPEVVARTEDESCSETSAP